MLSWIITFVILILILEDGVFAVLERRAFAWRARISQLKDFETAGARIFEILEARELALVTLINDRMIPVSLALPESAFPIKVRLIIRANKQRELRSG